MDRRRKAPLVLLALITLDVGSATGHLVGEDELFPSQTRRLRKQPRVPEPNNHATAPVGWRWVAIAAGARAAAGWRLN